MTSDKKKKKKKKKKREAEAGGRAAADGEIEIDAREAARALKQALAESAEESGESDESTARPRRRRPPTSHGTPLPRPARRRRPTPEPEPPDPKLSPPSLFARHDLAVVLMAAALLAGGALTYRSLSAVATERLEILGLSLDRPSALLPPVELTPPGSKVSGDGSSLPYHIEHQSPASPSLRLEILVEPRPAYNNLHAARALDRASRHGEMYWSEPTDTVKIAGRNWVRTRFRYAHKAHDFGTPEVASAVEFATLNGGLLYVVTAHGTPDEASELAALIAPTLNADPNHPAASIRPETAP
jgi:hypothetical protein